MSTDDTHDPDAWMNGGRSKTGRFAKSFSGNPKGRPRKERQDATSLQFARDVLDEAETAVEVKENGRKKKLSLTRVILRRLGRDAANGDKPSERLFLKHLETANKLMDQRQQRHYERLGSYLRALDEGRGWQLNAAEAAYYQGLADEAGIPVHIPVFDPLAQPKAVTAEEVTAIVRNEALLRSLGQRFETMGEGEFVEVTFKILGALRRFEFERSSWRGPVDSEPTF